MDRNSKEGRHKAVEQIRTYAKDAKMPPLVIFPQGICSRIDTLTSFKAGAFLTGEPVQPLTLDFTANTRSNISFIRHSFVHLSTFFCRENPILTLCFIGMLWEVFFHGMCQFVNFCEITYLRK